MTVTAPHSRLYAVGRLVLLVAAIALTVWGISLVAFSNSMRDTRVGIPIAFWGVLAGYAAIRMGNARTAASAPTGDGANGAVDDSEPQASTELVRERDEAARREYEVRLELMLRRELEQGLREELAALRRDVAELRGDVLDAVDGRLRMERVEITRIIGSNLAALHDDGRISLNPAADVTVPASASTDASERGRDADAGRDPSPSWASPSTPGIAAEPGAQWASRPAPEPPTRPGTWLDPVRERRAPATASPAVSPLASPPAFGPPASPPAFGGATRWDGSMAMPPYPGTPSTVTEAGPGPDPGYPRSGTVGLEPESVEPESVEPESVEPQVAEPQLAEPQVGKSRSEVGDPELIGSGFEVGEPRSEIGDPELVGSGFEVGQLEVTESRSQVGQSDGVEPEPEVDRSQGVQQPQPELVRSRSDVGEPEPVEARSDVGQPVGVDPEPEPEMVEPWSVVVHTGAGLDRGSTGGATAGEPPAQVVADSGVVGREPSTGGATASGQVTTGARADRPRATGTSAATPRPAREDPFADLPRLSSFRLPDLPAGVSVAATPAPAGSVGPEPLAGSVGPEPVAGSVDPEPSAGSVDPEPRADSVDPEPPAGSVDPEPLVPEPLVAEPAATRAVAGYVGRRRHAVQDDPQAAETVSAGRHGAGPEQEGRPAAARRMGSVPASRHRG